VKWKQVIHPGRHSQQDFTHYRNVVEVLAVYRRLGVVFEFWVGDLDQQLLLTIRP
jgi:hypothetical protein